MSEELLKFISIERDTPEKRSSDARKQDFAEIYAEFSAAKAKQQASRCSQCGIPFCQSGCPLHNNIPDWLKMVAENRLEEAYNLSQATNTFPEICGRICPQDRLCEGVCVIEQSGHGTVTIGAVEKYITETAWENGWVTPPLPFGGERSESVGIIGAGPAGLAAADMLRKYGFQVVVYDRYDRAGGLLTYGIPGFKLEKPVVMRRIEQLRQAGVIFELDTDVGTTISFETLYQKHDCLLIATGVYKSRNIEIEASQKNVLKALDFLTASNRRSFADAISADKNEELDTNGKDVVVIGGGDTAMDCVRTAIRQGAKSVKCLYRRDRENMPGSQREVQNAEEEGVVFEWLTQPKAFLGDGRVTGVEITRMRLGQKEISGRMMPEEIPNSEETIKADVVILALGFEPEPLVTLWNTPELRVSKYGTISVDPLTKETSLPRVYAAGDIVRGASLVVWAIRDGRDAATAMINSLERQS